MHTPDHDLNRLFKAAAQARSEAASEAPFGFEGRVLAQLRTRPGNGEELFALPMLRRALAVACVLALIALAVSLRELTQRPSDEVVIINAPITLTYLP